MATEIKFRNTEPPPPYLGDIPKKIAEGFQQLIAL